MARWAPSRPARAPRTWRPALALGELWFKVPETLRFEVNGKLGDRVYSKDVILKLIGDVGADGARYQACEYAGKVVRDLTCPSG